MYNLKWLYIPILFDLKPLGKFSIPAKKKKKKGKRSIAIRAHVPYLRSVVPPNTDIFEYNLNFPD